MELTANNRPFLYFPLAHHFEQNFHVRHRLERYGAGRWMDFEESFAEVIAEAIAQEIGREVDYKTVEADGARRRRPFSASCCDRDPSEGRSRYDDSSSSATYRLSGGGRCTSR